MPAALSVRGPRWVVPGGRIAIDVSGVAFPTDGPPPVRIGDQDAHVIASSAGHVRAIVPASDGGSMPVQVAGVAMAIGEIQVARPLATAMHLVDSPAFDGLGRLYATHSGSRDSKAAVPLYRISEAGAREPIAVEIGNPTSLAFGGDGCLYVSSRFEGHVYRMWPDDRVELYATELGVPTGIAFGPDGALYVGDRSGSILRVSSDRQVDTFASLPPSVAAFHLAFGPDGALYVTAPTLATHDAVYRISVDRMVDVVSDRFGRPQGLAFEASGDLYVVDALAGASGVYRVDITGGGEPELVVSGPTLIGLAFDPLGGLVVASNDSIWKLDVDMRPWVPT
jgi:sugar lactone lactonase YvrE